MVTGDCFKLQKIRDRRQHSLSSIECDLWSLRRPGRPVHASSKGQVLFAGEFRTELYSTEYSDIGIENKRNRAMANVRADHPNLPPPKSRAFFNLSLLLTCLNPIAETLYQKKSCKRKKRKNNTKRHSSSENTELSSPKPGFLHQCEMSLICDVQPCFKARHLIACSEVRSRGTQAPMHDVR